VLRFDGDNGTAEASMEAGGFRCPFALSPTDTDYRFELSLVEVPSKFEPSSCTVRAIDIWHVNCFGCRQRRPATPTPVDRLLHVADPQACATRSWIEHLA
jgi:hypothetical protein